MSQTGLQVWLLGLNSYLQQHKLAVAIVVGLLWSLAGLCMQNLKLDTTVLSFFPADNVAMSKQAKAMDLAPFTRFLFVDLTLEQATSKMHHLVGPKELLARDTEVRKKT